jgi:hypothetical protein
MTFKPTHLANHFGFPLCGAPCDPLTLLTVNVLRVTCGRCAHHMDELDGLDEEQELSPGGNVLPEETPNLQWEESLLPTLTHNPSVLRLGHE